jgi:hypothetical protein
MSTLKTYESGKGITSKNEFKKKLIEYLYDKYKIHKQLSEYSIYNYIVKFFVSKQSTQFEVFLEGLENGQIDVDEGWYLFPHMSEEYLSILINSNYTKFEHFRASFMIQLVNTIYDNIHIVNKYQVNYILNHKFELYESFQKKILYQKYGTHDIFLRYLHEYIHQGQNIKNLCKKFGPVSSDGDYGITPNIKILKFLDDYLHHSQDYDNMIRSDFVEYLCENKDFEREILRFNH